MMYESVFTWLAAIAAFVAAALWYKASVVKVPPQKTPDESGWTPASYGSSDMEIGLTAQAQSMWNARAAIAAAISAVFMGVSLVARGSM